MGLRGATGASRGLLGPAQAVVAFWGATGALALAAAARHLWVAGWPGATTTTFAVVVGALLAASWVRPVVLCISARTEDADTGTEGTDARTEGTDARTEAFDLDEAFFVLLILLVPGALTVLVFAVAAVVAQAVRRRPPVASVSAVGRAVTSAGLGAVVFGLAQASARSTGYTEVGAALAGALAYLAVDTAASASIAAASGARWQTTALSGVGGRLLVTAVSVAVAVPTALLVGARPAYFPVALLPLLVLRYLAEGHSSARSDRLRLRGLFEATLDVHRSIGGEETRAAVLSSAGSLLRSPEVRLGSEPPAQEDDTLAAPVELADRRLWLSVSGRSRTEPFDDTDRTLLDALASVGAIALANADLLAEVERQKDSLSVIASSLGEGVCAVSRSGRITFMNPAGATMLGWPEAEIAEDGPVAVEAPQFLSDPAMRAMASGQNVVTEDARFERSDGTQFAVTMTASPVLGEAQPSAAVIVFRDTSHRRAFEEQLARHAFQDPLTGLANRRLLLDHLDHALLQAERSGGRVAVLFGDIDRFKAINDNLGHQVGDELLRVVAERLRRTVRPGDTLSRFGGDEFVVLLEGVTSPEDAAHAAGRVLEVLREPILLSGGHEVEATMSIGMALSEPESTRDDLLHHADVAMYRAKEKGRGGRVTLFDADPMEDRAAGRLDLDAALHHAVERGEVEVYFQPLVSLADQQIVAAEALLRWDHSEHGILTPGQFMELAEDNGSILTIGRTVLEQACHRVKAWDDTIGVRLEVGVNLSARQFQLPELADDVAAVLASTGIEPSQLCLEVTESLAMRDVDTTSAVLTTLHGLGIRLAIDDFGTGHSSLGYLARFPIDVIKVDQSFVRNIDQDPVKSAIVSAVVALSRAIGSTTVVEGVETLPELEQLEVLGCDVAQGFYFSRPLPAGAFAKLVADQAPRPGGRLRQEVLTG